MPKQIMYLIRRLARNTQYTIVSTSPRAAMLELIIKYPAFACDEDFAVKERGLPEWDSLWRKVAKGEVRKLPT